MRLADWLNTAERDNSIAENMSMFFFMTRIIYLCQVKEYSDKLIIIYFIMTDSTNIKLPVKFRNPGVRESVKSVRGKSLIPGVTIATQARFTLLL